MCLATAVCALSDFGLAGLRRAAAHLGYTPGSPVTAHVLLHRKRRKGPKGDIGRPKITWHSRRECYEHINPPDCARSIRGTRISPAGGYVGGGLQKQVDIDIDPAGNVWVTNNWQDIDSCIGTPSEALSTRCGGQGVVIFYGMAEPVRAPQIGPARARRGSATGSSPKHGIERSAV